MRRHKKIKLLEANAPCDASSRHAGVDYLTIPAHHRVVDSSLGKSNESALSVPCSYVYLKQSFNWRVVFIEEDCVLCVRAMWKQDHDNFFFGEFVSQFNGTKQSTVLNESIREEEAALGRFFWMTFKWRTYVRKALRAQKVASDLFIY